MPYPTPAAVALAIAIMFKRSGKSRARITEKTFRLIAKRRFRLHESFMSNFRSGIEDLDVIAIPLDRRGFGLIPRSALEGAPLIKAADLLERELPNIKKGQIDEAALWSELDSEETEDGETED